MLYATKKIISILVISYSVVLGQEIVHPPKDRTVFLGDGHGAFFSCITLDSPFTHWMLNETDYNNLPSDIRDDLVSSSASAVHSQLIDLTIPARAKYNGTRVQCVAESDDGHLLVSSTATLTIQGVLTSVTSLRLSGNISFITISWSAPFSLDVTGDGPDIWYSVLIYNAIDNQTAIPCTDCTNIIETHYTFHSLCQVSEYNYTFIIIPLNGAGRGPGTNIITDNNIHAINIRKFGISAVNATARIVTFSVSGEMQRICDYTLHGISDDGSGEIDSISMKGGDPIEVGGYITYILPAHRFYTAIYFEIKSAAGDFNTTSDNFTTFDIQDYNATEENGKIEVSGVLITNSTDKGYFIVIVCNNNSSDVFRVIEREGPVQNMQELIGVPPSSYTVYAYDLEADALPYPMPATTPPNEKINITTNSSDNSTSIALKSANLTQNGSNVTVYCELADQPPTASCVLVYREYFNTTLNYREFKENTTFSIAITGGIYSFAVFGRNNDKHIDGTPLVSKRVVFNETVTRVQVIFEANKIPQTSTPSISTSATLEMTTPTSSVTVSTPYPTLEQPMYHGDAIPLSSSVSVLITAVFGGAIVIMTLLMPVGVTLPMKKEQKLTVPHKTVHIQLDISGSGIDALRSLCDKRTTDPEESKNLEMRRGALQTSEGDLQPHEPLPEATHSQPQTPMQPPTSLQINVKSVNCSSMESEHYQRPVYSNHLQGCSQDLQMGGAWHHCEYAPPVARAALDPLAHKPPASVAARITKGGCFNLQGRTDNR